MTEQSRSLRAGFLIHDVSRLRRNVFDQAMRPHGITRAQWWILSSLMDFQTKGMTQSELAKHLDLSRVAVGEFIGRLENLGYLVRSADSMDGRVKRVHLTSAGEKVVRKMRAVGMTIEDKIHSGLSPTEQASLEVILNRLKDNLLSFEGSFDGR